MGVFSAKSFGAKTFAAQSFDRPAAQTPPPPPVDQTVMAYSSGYVPGTRTTGQAG